jgi:hypothetical protein
MSSCRSRWLYSRFQDVAAPWSLDSWFHWCLPVASVVPSEGPSYSGSSCKFIPCLIFPSSLFDQRSLMTASLECYLCLRVRCFYFCQGFAGVSRDYPW